MLFLFIENIFKIYVIYETSNIIFNIWKFYTKYIHILNVIIINLYTYIFWFHITFYQKKKGVLKFNPSFIFFQFIKCDLIYIHIIIKNSKLYDQIFW
jgi:hypothetical protein